MEENFIYENPTKIYFGKDALSYLPEELKKYGKNILFVYGGGSIKKSGLYERITQILKEAGKTVFEVTDVLPNPTLDKMNEGAKVSRENKIDLILAVGGGSVIDCAKGMSVAAYHDNAFDRYWINYEDFPEGEKVVPVASILTMVGTGSEMNGGSVITDEVRHLKAGRVFPPFVYPRFSILDPTLTYSVPAYQTLSGSFDILSHLMEQYFAGKEQNVSDYLLEGLMKSVIANLPQAIKNPSDYEARSNLMWTATMALNTISGVGKPQDWEVHGIEHQLSAYTHCSHGMGLAVISVPYYRYIYKYGIRRFARFATEVWDVMPQGEDEQTLAEEGINKLEKFIKKMGIPTTLRELGASEDMLPKIASSCLKGGGYKQLDEKDILAILKACY
jgi:alcohol dehydrogenase YqhD (iron-dependent ADH family)